MQTIVRTPSINIIPDIVIQAPAKLHLIKNLFKNETDHKSMNNHNADNEILSQPGFINNKRVLAGLCFMCTFNICADSYGI